jgi:hypothetical protein
MINFKALELEDQAWMVPLLMAAGLQNSQYSFANLFAWSVIYPYYVARVDDCLLIKGINLDGTPSYFFPAGPGDLKSLLLAMRQDAAAAGFAFKLIGLSPDNLSVINRLFPGQFKFIEICGLFDYVYLLDHLARLPGRKLSAKRNHINYFLRNNQWSFEPLTLNNLAECWEMNQAWYKTRDLESDQHLAQECLVVRRFFEFFTELGLEGGLLRSAGKIVAYTMGSRLNAYTFDIHVEKAFSEIRGAYQMINREFARLIQKEHPEIIYVNREDDQGHLGIRQAKLSYAPIRIERKYLGKYKG